MHIGYERGFLGLEVPLPVPAAANATLNYLHFSVAFRPDRRLAAVSAVNIHGGLLRDIERIRDVWILDRGSLPPIDPTTPSTTPTTSTAAT